MPAADLKCKIDSEVVIMLCKLDQDVGNMPYRTTNFVTKSELSAKTIVCLFWIFAKFIIIHANRSYG